MSKYIEEMKLLHGDKEKLLEELHKCTSEAMVINPIQAYHVASTVCLIEKIMSKSKDYHDTLKELGLYEMESLENTEECNVEEDIWGDSDTQARQLFETLEKHYAGFWRCVAEYQKAPSEETKMRMLQHFEHQLQSHDMLAMFVRGNCPILCEEIKAILGNWMAKKKATINSM